MWNDKHMVNTILENKANSYLYTHTEAKRLIFIEDRLTTFRSLLGYTLNYYYDQLANLELNDEDFARVVREEITNDYQIFMFLLRDKKSIEVQIDRYIKENYKDILATDK